MRPNDRAWRPSAAALLFAAALVPAVAADKPCGAADAAGAEKAADAVTSWGALQKAVRDFGHCDRDKAAPLFTDALLRVLIDGWPNLAQGEAILDKDPALREWVAVRLSGKAIAPEDAKSVTDLAKGNCPKGRAATCEFLLDAQNRGKPMEMPKLMQVPKT